MSSEPVQPLRIQKSTPASSPSKMASSTTRPLSEISPIGIRRNSPSFNQVNKGQILKGDSSPFGSSPFNNNPTSSPRLFWQGRDPTASPGRLSAENRNPFERDSTPPVPSKRSSIENLKRASRVKNSSMFAREHKNEYDPSQITPLDRPLAAGRPLSMQFQGNAYGGKGVEGLRKAQAQEATSPTKSSPAKVANPKDEDTVAPLSPSKNHTSPMKSSLSKKTGKNARNMGFDPENGIWSDDEETKSKALPQGRFLHRHAKSVTFDQAPPQVNEYEMTTPDPSSIASGSREGSYDSAEDEDENFEFERGSFIDHEDSFDASLEDTDKTPVVLPEDWRFMSPDNANDALAKHEEDPFNGEYGSPEPTATPGASMDQRPHQTSVNSVDSTGQPRPLPPLPNLSPQKNSSPEANKRLSGTLERVSSAQRALPSPPLPSPISKSDLRGMGSGSKNLDDRLRLMMLQDNENEKTEAEKQRERRMRRANSKDRSPVRETTKQNLDLGKKAERADSTDAEDTFSSPPRISRDSILAKIRGRPEYDFDEGDDDCSPEVSSSPERPLPDPDVAIPSTEDDGQLYPEKNGIVKEEEEEIDLYSIPDMYANATAANGVDEEDDASEYSQPSLAHEPVLPQRTSTEDDGQDTPRANSPAREEKEMVSTDQKKMALPAFANFDLSNDFDFGLNSYISKNPTSAKFDAPSKPAAVNPFQHEEQDRSVLPDTKVEVNPEQDNEDDEDGDRPGTPGSVIRHPTEDSLTDTESDLTSLQDDDDHEPAPPIPEKHHKRPSLGVIDNPPARNPTDTEEPKVVKTEKRISSLVQLEIPRVESDEGLSLGLDKEFDRVIEAQKVAFELSLRNLYTPFNGRFPSSEYPRQEETRKSQARALPGAERGEGQGFTPNTDRFANRNSVRQRGYLMRQNTKVVVASNRTEEPTEENDKQAGSTTATRKASQSAWTTEPWSGKSRRKSIRVASGGSPRKRYNDGPVPPLPGQASNVQGDLNSVNEATADEEYDGEQDDERGRLFVKVVGVKEIDLPLPRTERSYFSLTLDNGLHCVTTNWLELGKTAPIGQEFELVVLKDLEFQLTLQLKLDEPRPVATESPVAAPSSPKKQSTFSRVFGSPKKRKDSDAKQAELQRSKSPTRPQQQSLYDMVQGLVARDGSFARAYVSLSEHEKKAFGRPYVVDITCFNEWAMEQATSGSTRTNRGFQRRPPYKIGKLELQMLYVPKPRGARDEDMPKSMNACIRELREAENCALTQWEGHLSQQGGDCPYWRRRFFKLNGTKLTAYHEATLQPRANINLSKAVKVIDDKTALTKKETSTKGGGRRKSGFAEEEEGYMFVEEGFRIRFANGEVIDFYADSTAEKDGWMRALSETVGKNAATGNAKPWTEIVLKQEQALAARKAARYMPPQAGHRKSSREERPQISPRKSSKETPRAQTSPRKPSKESAYPPTNPEKSTKEFMYPQARPQSPRRQQQPVENRKYNPLPSQNQWSPSQLHPTRPTHTRRESHQEGQMTSSVKEKLAARQQKARSMMM